MLFTEPDIAIQEQVCKKSYNNNIRLYTLF